MKKIFILMVLVIILLANLATNLVPQEARALDFSANDIICDADLLEYDSLSLESIQEFLNYQNGILKNFRAFDYFGIETSPAEMIYNAALAYKINPKWILTTLQKEQSLVTNPSPSQRDIDWAMGYAVCDSCSVDDPKVAMFKGLGTQIDRATYRMRYYYDHPEEFNNQFGRISVIDGQEVMPYNQATANLYNYTPHLHGNYNFWNIWNRWFAKIYPDGSLIQQEGQPGVYLIENGKRRPFWSKIALTSRYDSSKIIKVSRNDLLRYDEGYPLKYPNYSLLQSAQGNKYLIVNNQKKLIESEGVFKKIGYNAEELINVTDDELLYYEDGPMITLSSLFPQGALLQDNQTGGVYYVEDGYKYPIPSKEILVNNFKKYKLTQVTPEELNNYLTAGIVYFKDGTLIKTKDESNVYVISNSQRRWIANEETFKQLGYRFSDIIDVSDKISQFHPLGETLDLLLPPESKIATQ